MEEATLRLFANREAAQERTEILDIGTGRGRKRALQDGELSPVAKAGRKKYSLMRLGRLRCKRRRCNGKHCRIHCQGCQRKITSHEDRTARTCCMCQRITVRACMTQVERDRSTIVGLEYWCTDCHKLRIDIVDDRNPVVPV